MLTFRGRHRGSPLSFPKLSWMEDINEMLCACPQTFLLARTTCGLEWLLADGQKEPMPGAVCFVLGVDVALRTLAGLNRPKGSHQ